MMKLFSGLIQRINQTLPPSCVVSQAVFAKWFGITELVFLREGWWETENGELKHQKHNYSHSASSLSEKEKKIKEFGGPEWRKETFPDLQHWISK